MKKAQFNYGILTHNDEVLSRESTLLDNKYKKTKYALIEKANYKDGSESINRIIYSNDLETLSKQLIKTYPTWYNYVIGIAMELQGTLFFLA